MNELTHTSISIYDSIGHRNYSEHYKCMYWFINNYTDVHVLTVSAVTTSYILTSWTLMTMADIHVVGACPEGVCLRES